MTLSEYICRHHETSDGLRLGQRFFNDFIKSDKELDDLNLFYEKDDNKTIWFIEKWLQDKHYFNELPPKLERD